MSDEESFVILGSSSFSSIDSNAHALPKLAREVIIAPNDYDFPQKVLIDGEVDGNGTELPAAVKLVTADEKIVVHDVWNVGKNNEEMDSLGDANIASAEVSGISNINIEKIPVQAEQSAIPSPVETQATGSQSIPTKIEVSDNAIDLNTSLATSFLLGEVNADVLKNSVYSQFPSLCSMQACAEDVVKLQNLMTEYINLKQTLYKVNSTMKKYYDASRQWREEAFKQQQIYLQKQQECQMQMEKLHADCNDLRQNIADKTLLIDEMREKINKLEEHQQLKSIDSIAIATTEMGLAANFPQDYIQIAEHAKIVKALEQDLTKLLTENLEIRGMQKIYVDEINCLKVNLTSAEELLQKANVDINVFKAKEVKTNDEIAFLQQQVSIYCKDFEMERADRERNASQKDQYLKELQTLQNRFKELVEVMGERNEMAAASLPKSKNQNQYSCPICSKLFDNLNSLQSHVNACLDKN